MRKYLYLVIAITPLFFSASLSSAQQFPPGYVDPEPLLAAVAEELVAQLTIDYSYDKFIFQ